LTTDIDWVLEVIRLTFVVSGIALAISSVLGIPVGAWLGLRRFPAAAWRA
jgi:ABC-type sulfate transport system permease component